MGIPGGEAPEDEKMTWAICVHTGVTYGELQDALQFMLHLLTQHLPEIYLAMLQYLEP